MKHLKIVWNKRWKILGWTGLIFGIVFNLWPVVSVYLICYFIRLASQTMEEIAEARELRIKHARWEALREVNKSAR